MSVPALLAVLERDRALGVDPAVTTLWLRAPEALRRRFADGYISVEDYWLALERWLRGIA